MNKTVSIVVIILLLLGGLVYLTTSNGSQTLQTENKTTEGSIQDKLRDEAMMRNEGSGSAMKDEGVMMEGHKGKVLAGKSAPLLNFQKSDYDEALKSDKLIVLYFYANWCPECRREVPEFYSAFDELSKDFNKYINKVIGFRVNYNDSDTDKDEVALAKEHGVAYQHTKVFLKNGNRILKSPESWDKQRYLDEINKALK